MIATARYSLLLVGFTLLALSVAAPAALATVVHGNYSGTTIDFLGVQETVNSSDPEPAGGLFEAPLLVGDSLFFFPSNFTADSANGDGGEGAGAIDQTNVQLQMQLSATSGTIDVVNLTEFGDVSLSDFTGDDSGTAATGAFVQLSGALTVLNAANPLDIGTIIPFVAVFDQDFFGLQGDVGASTFTGSASIDVASSVPGVTLAMLSIDNILTASSEADTSAFIQKKVTGALVVSVPEPTSLALIGLGLAGAVLVGRRRNA